MNEYNPVPGMILLRKADKNPEYRVRMEVLENRGKACLLWDFRNTRERLISTISVVNEFEPEDG